MKKFISFLVVIMILCCAFLFGGCNYFQYSEYPFLEKTEEKNIIYNGNEYIYIGGNTVDRTYLRDDRWYYLDYAKLSPVGSVWHGIIGGLPSRCLVYVSDLDIEENILYIDEGYPCCYVKEGFEFPDIYETNIADIYLGIDRMQILCGGSKNIFSNSLNAEIVFYDLVESEVSMIDDSGIEECAQCYFQLENYEFLQCYGMKIYEIEDLLYCQTASTSYGNREYYKIKDEYQEAFRNAITELEMLVETSESAT